LDCEPKKVIAVFTGRFPISIVYEELPKELQEIVKTHEELLRIMTERENRLRELSEEVCSIIIECRDDFIPEYILEEHLPLWRQHNFTDRANFRNIGSSFCRNYLRRARANLWSGQRKRQGVEF